MVTDINNTDKHGDKSDNYATKNADSYREVRGADVRLPVRQLRAAISVQYHIDSVMQVNIYIHVYI